MWLPFLIIDQRKARKFDVAEIEVKLVETEAELEGAINVRMRVFVVEQQIPAEVELDEADATATHAVALHQGEVIGTGRLVIEEGEAGSDGPVGRIGRIGRMAVDQTWRRQGVGGQILQFLEGEAHAQGLTHCILHAQEYVKNFYAGLGYQERGEVFLEENIPHIEMWKGL